MGGNSEARCEVFEREWRKRSNHLIYALGMGTLNDDSIEMVTSLLKNER